MAIVFLAVCGWLVGQGDIRAADDSPLVPRVPEEDLNEAKALRNPFDVTREFVEKGRSLYYGRAFCSACHGLDGTGKQAGRDLSEFSQPLPTNFADGAWQAARTDGELFWILAFGSHGTDMAPFLPFYITEEEAWQLVAYIRSFGKT